jgi:hypothetical protein
MELTGPACTEALNEAEEDESRERAEDNAGGVRVELRVRPTPTFIRFVDYELVFCRLIEAKNHHLIQV